MLARPVILFACVHNGGRSLAGKVLTEHYANGAVDVRSAGSEPGDFLNPTVVEVLRERGLSTAGEAPKLLTRDGVVEADIVITMGCGEACPYVPGKRIVDWELEDPKGQAIDAVRSIVNDIDGRVRALLAELGVVVTPGTAAADRVRTAPFSASRQLNARRASDPAVGSRGAGRRR